MGINVAEAGRGVGRVVAESVYDNAVVTKEFRTRMRGTKPYVLMGGYVLLLSVVLAIVFFSVAESMMRTGQYNPLSVVDRVVGATLFTSLTIAQVVLLILVLPSLTAGSITTELERQTIDMLALSRLTPGKVVLGKHLSGFLYAMVLLLCSLPLAGLCLLFGGVSPVEVAITYALLATWAFMVTAASVMWSSLFKRTTAASLCSYATCFVYMLVTTSLGSVAMDVMRHSRYMGHPGMATTSGFAFSVFNPAFGLMMGMQTADVGGFHLSVSLIAAVLEVATGVLMLLVASTHVRYQRANRSLPIRLLLIAITTAIAWLLATSFPFFGIVTSPDLAGWLGGCSIILLIALSLAIPMFATGVIRKPANCTVLTYALSLRKLFSNNLGGAIAFAALWTTIVFGALGGALVLGSRYSTFIGHTTGAFAPVRGSGPGLWGVYWGIFVSSVAVVVGITALGILFSSMCKLRRNAISLLILAVIVLFAGYGVMLIGYNSADPGTSPVWSLAALWPITPTMCAIGGWRGLPPLSYIDYAWAVTTITYLGIALVALAAAGTCHGNGMGIKEEE